MNAEGDRQLMCRDCARQFVFEAGEQAFFERKGFPPPVRCPSCRAIRRRQPRQEFTHPGEW